MGRLALQGGQLAQAQEHLTTAHTLQQQLGDVTGLARSTPGLADLCLQAGQWEEAMALLSDSLQLNMTKGSPIGLAFNRRALHTLAQASSQAPGADEARWRGGVRRDGRASGPSGIALWSDGIARGVCHLLGWCGPKVVSSRSDVMHGDAQMRSDASPRGGRCSCTMPYHLRLLLTTCHLKGQLIRPPATPWEEHVMALVEWEPFASLSSLRREMDRVWESFVDGEHLHEFGI